MPGTSHVSSTGRWRAAVQRVDDALDGLRDRRHGADRAREHRLQRREILRAHDRVGVALPEGGAQRQRAHARRAQAGGGRGAGLGAKPAHALHGARRADAAAVGAARHDADAGHHLRRRAREVHGHEAARGEAEHQEVRIAQRALGLHAPREGEDLAHLARRRRGFAREPVPAAVGVVTTALRGVDDHQAAALGGGVEPGAEREVLRRLPAAMQRDDERARRRCARREERVAAALVPAAHERPRGPRRRRREHDEAQRKHGPHGQRGCDGSSTRAAFTSQTPSGLRRTAGRKSADRNSSVKNGSWNA